MRGAFVVDEMQGERWDLAVALLQRGEGIVSLGPLLLYRATSGPRDDGKLHVEICSAWQQRSLTMATAQAEVKDGLVRLEAVLSDQRVAGVAADHGLDCHYVEDYETARIALAVVALDGTIAWDHFTPRP